MKIKKYKSLEEAVITEDNVSPEVEKVADSIGAEEVVTPKESKGAIYEALDESLRTARTKQKVAAKTGKKSKNFPNVLFIGGAGVGKTAQIEAWAEDRGINLFSLQGSSLDAADMGGLPTIQNIDGKIKAQKAGTGILDQLDRENSVLFLDELNRARQDVRAALLQLINDHIVQDFESDGGMRYFPNFLFTVAAINPAGNAGYQTFELDPAEKGRFRNIPVGVDNAVTMNWAVKYFTDQADILEEDDPEEATAMRGRAQLAKAIMGNPSFDFDDPQSEEEAADTEGWNGLATSPRNLTLLLDACNGTKNDLLKKWGQFCNSLHEGNVKRILGNYKDIENKANSVFNQGTRSSLLNKRKDNSMDALRRKYANM